MKKLIFFLFVGLLGAQTQINYTTQVKNKPALDSREFQFTRTNGLGASGDLSVAGTNKVITLTPGPKGLAGTNVSPYVHYVYVSGGTGTAEAVLVSGGTCLGTGETSCTIWVNTANTHTGAWTLTSATGGIQEAAYSLLPVTGEFSNLGSGGGIVQTACGTINLYNTLYIPGNVTITGKGNCTNLTATFAGQVMVSTVIYQSKSGLTDMTLDRANLNNVVGLDLHSTSEGNFGRLKIIRGAITGSIGIRLRTTGNGILNSPSDNVVLNRIYHITIIEGARGIVMEGDAVYEGDTKGHLTFNDFDTIYMNLNGNPGVDIVAQSDHNSFQNISLAFGGNAGAYGVVFNSGGPNDDKGVVGNSFRHLHVDGSGDGSGNCVRFNRSQANAIWDLRSASGCTTLVSANAYGLYNTIQSNRGSEQTLGLGVTVPDGSLHVASDAQHSYITGHALVLSGMVDKTYRLHGGYDPVNNFGYFQSNQKNVANQELRLNPAGGLISTGDGFVLKSLSFLPIYPDGTMVYCSVCQVTGVSDNTCITGGSGALAVHINGVWRCFATQN